MGCSSDSLRYHRKHSATGVLLHLSRDKGGPCPTLSFLSLFFFSFENGKGNPDNKRICFIPSETLKSQKKKGKKLKQTKMKGSTGNISTLAISHLPRKIIPKCSFGDIPQNEFPEFPGSALIGALNFLNFPAFPWRA